MLLYTCIEGSVIHVVMLFFCTCHSDSMQITSMYFIPQKRLPGKKKSVLEYMAVIYNAVTKKSKNEIIIKNNTVI